MAESSGEKSQDATAHRRQQAREEGQVPLSQDLGSAILLLAGVFLLMQLGGACVDFFARLLTRHIGGEAWLMLDDELLKTQSTWLLANLARTVLPILALMMLFAILVQLGQVGILWLPEKLMPDITRLDPLKGLQRIFSLSGVVRLGFGMFKVVVVFVVAGMALYGRHAEILALVNGNIDEIGAFMTEIVLNVSLKVGFALLVLAILDYGYQRWKYEQDLKMTTQEVREEMKDLQGDPQIIARRRAVQRQLVLNRLGSAVPKADVVVTNPTELAIAIQYNPDEMAAPIVVAKGAGVVAQRIRKLALENNIPIVEKKPLARALYKDVDIGHPIPTDLYAAVAEVLAYVYQLKGKSINKPAA